MENTDHPAAANRSAAAAAAAAADPTRFAVVGVHPDPTDWQSVGCVLRALMAELEAEEAERELAAALAPFARKQLATDIEGRREAVRMVRAKGGQRGDKFIARVLAADWSDEHIRRYGPAPAPRTVRRWLRIYCETGSLPSRSYLAAGSKPIAKLAPGTEDDHLGQRVATRMSSAASWAAAVPAIGDVVEIDGARLRCIGRTASGRTRLVEMDGPVGVRPVVRSLQRGERFTTVTVH